MKITLIAAAALTLAGIAQASTAPASAPAVAQPPAGTAIPVLRSAEVPAPRPTERAQAAPISTRDRAAQEAVRRWEQTGTADALVGAGGDIRFAYGYSRATITCAPLHVCTVRLIAGETITSLALGDTVRWIAEQTTAGDTPVILIKPTQGGISTNLVVTTDAGRIYYMHLVGSAREYMPMVGFFDPASLSQRNHAQVAEMQRMRARLQAAEDAARKARDDAERRTAEHRERTVVAEMPATFDPTTLNFSMTCRPNSRPAASFVPSRIFSTATHTFIQLPEGLEGKELPAIFRRAANGNMELLNSRRSGQFIVIDGTPDHISLALDVGFNARVVDCQRGTNRSNAQATAD